MATILEKTGKTVEDALQAALNELGVSADDVDVEVLVTPSKGIFGLFGAKPAKIRVTVKEILPLPVETESAEKITEFAAGVENEVVESASEVAEESAKVEAVVESVEIAGDSDAAIESAEEVVATEKPPVDKAEVILAAKKFLSEVFAVMKLDIEMSDREVDSVSVIDLHGQNLGTLIGKRGQNLEALQYLMNLAANRIHGGERIHIVLDVENYREQRAAAVKRIAKNVAERVIRTNRDVKLEPMNRSERRLVHTLLQDNERVSTHSAGEDPYRYIIVSPRRRGR